MNEGLQGGQQPDVDAEGTKRSRSVAPVPGSCQVHARQPNSSAAL